MNNHVNIAPIDLPVVVHMQVIRSISKVYEMYDTLYDKIMYIFEIHTFFAIYVSSNFIFFLVSG